MASIVSGTDSIGQWRKNRETQSGAGWWWEGYAEEGKGWGDESRQGPA